MGREFVSGSLDAAAAAIEGVSVGHGGGYFLMAEELLNGSDFVAVQEWGDGE